MDAEAPISSQAVVEVAEGDPAGMRVIDPSAMKPLPSAKQEKFCQLVCQGISYLRAFEEAGFAGDKGNSSRLARRPKVRARIEWLKRKAAERAILSKETVTGRLLELADAAENLRIAAGYNVARQAVMDAAQINGLVVSRSETKRIDDFAALTPNERDILRNSLQKLAHARTKQLKLVGQPSTRSSSSTADDAGQDRRREQLSALQPL